MLTFGLTAKTDGARIDRSYRNDAGNFFSKVNQSEHRFVQIVKGIKQLKVLQSDELYSFSKIDSL